MLGTRASASAPRAWPGNGAGRWRRYGYTSQEKNVARLAGGGSHDLTQEGDRGHQRGHTPPQEATEYPGLRLIALDAFSKKALNKLINGEIER